MSSLSDFLTRIANSIRKVKGTNAQINAQNFPTEIEKMSASSNYFLQWKCDNMNSLSYEFYGYSGTSLDDMLTGLDTSNVNNMAYMFYNCMGLTTVPPLNTSKVNNFLNMFYGCTKLTTIPQLDTYTGGNFSNMFYDCTKLTTIPLINLSNSTGHYSIFEGCKNLTNITVLNIKDNLQVGSGTSWGHLLTLDSLIGLCKECIKFNHSKTLTVGSANMEKLANVYIKFTDSAQTTIDVGAKGDVVQCESTDEGAMLISDYMGLKNWKLA